MFTSHYSSGSLGADVSHKFSKVVKERVICQQTAPPLRTFQTGPRRERDRAGLLTQLMYTEL